MHALRINLVALLALSLASIALSQQPVEPWDAVAQGETLTEPWTAPIPVMVQGDDGEVEQVFPGPCLPADAACPPIEYQLAPPARKPMLPPGRRKSFFQSLNVTATEMPAIEDDSVGITHLQTSVMLAVPFVRRETPLIISPGYGLRVIEGPTELDVPARLHDAEIDFSHFRPLNDTWLLNVGIGVGMYADDASFGQSDAWRASGRVLGLYRINNDWKGVIGVVYVNRADWSLLPAVGFIYDTPDVKYDLVFPKPKAAYRLWHNGEGIDERWVYVSGEFGGGIWSVERANGTPDELSTSDYRILIGTERKQAVPGISRRFEIGYVFGRKLEYESGAELSVDDTLLVRAAFTY